MKLRFLMCLALAVAACDKPEPGGRDLGKSTDAPLRARPPRPEPPDPRAAARRALENADRLDPTAGRERALAKVAWDSLELDPDLARDAIDRLAPDGAEKIRLIQHLAMRTAEGNPDEALQWAATLDSEPERAAAYGHIALVISATDPARAANLLSESGIEGRAFDVVVVQVLGRWAAQSPPDAAAWVAMFPPGKSREAGIGSVVSTWVQSDAAAAFSWMGALQDPALREESSKAMAEALLRQPEEIRQKSLETATPELRRELEARWEAGEHETRPPSR
jgi:hypothetical protein